MLIQTTNPLEGWLVVTRSPGRLPTTPTPRAKHGHFLVVLFSTMGLFPLYSYFEGVALARAPVLGWSLLIDFIP